MGKFLKAIETFNPNDSSTHVPYSFQKDVQNGERLLVIQTPNNELIPYNPKDHNDPNQENGILPGYKLLKYTYKQYDYHSKQRKLAAERGSNVPRIPTEEEVAILTADKLDAYLANGFDPSKGDGNRKCLSSSDKSTEILVLENKIFGNCYQPYIPSKHGTEVSTKAIKVGTHQTYLCRARKKYKAWLAMQGIATETTTTTPIPITATTTTTTSTATTTTTTTSSHPEDGICDAIVLPSLISTLRKFAPQTNCWPETTYAADKEEMDKDVSTPASSNVKKRKADELSDLPSVTKYRSSFFYDSDSGDDDTKRSSNNVPSNPNTSTGTSWRPWE